MSHCTPVINTHKISVFLVFMFILAFSGPFLPLPVADADGNVS